jgi:hypothetical protein
MLLEEATKGGAVTHDACSNIDHRRIVHPHDYSIVIDQSRPAQSVEAQSLNLSKPCQKRVSGRSIGLFDYRSIDLWRRQVF